MAHIFLLYIPECEQSWAVLKTEEKDVKCCLVFYDLTKSALCRCEGFMYLCV